MITTRRNFFKSLIAAIALSPALARLGERVVVRSIEAEPVKVSRQYLDAAYEEVLIVHSGVARMFPFRAMTIDEDAPRFNFVNGEFVRVYPKA